MDGPMYPDRDRSPTEGDGAKDGKYAPPAAPTSNSQRNLVDRLAFAYLCTGEDLFKEAAAEIDRLMELQR